MELREIVEGDLCCGSAGVYNVINPEPAAQLGDRKAGHVIRRGEQVYGVDHGVCFHDEPKLRTILWGWSGEELTDEETALLHRTLEVAEEALAPWLSPAEVAATVERAAQLLAEGRFPEPGDAWPVIPWPPI